MTTKANADLLVLQLPQVKSALKLSEVSKLSTAVSNGQKKKFLQTLTLSVLVLEGFEWFKSEEGKRVLGSEAITWTTEQFAKNVYGWERSYFYKLVKAGGLDLEVIHTFQAQCDEMELNGVEPQRTLEGLLKFAKVSEKDGSEGGEGEGEAKVEAKAKAVFTMTYKREDGNVAVRVNDDGEVKTTNSREEIAQAIAFLQEQMAGITEQVEKVEQVTAPAPKTAKKSKIPSVQVKTKSIRLTTAPDVFAMNSSDTFREIFEIEGIEAIEIED
jgi:hypothetical protein